MHGCNDIASLQEMQRPVRGIKPAMQHEALSDEDIRDRTARVVRMIMDHTGRSASQLAREAGVSPSTLTRLLDENGKFVPTNTTVQKINRMLNQHVKVIGREAADAHAEIHRQHSKARMMRLEGIPIVGEIKAGAWIKRPKAAEQQPPQILPLVDRSWPVGSIVAYQMADDYSDPTIPKGANVIINVDDKGPEFPIGTRVLLQRRAEIHGGTMVELALWEVGLGEDGAPTLKSRADGSETLDLPIDEEAWMRDVDVVGPCIGVYIK